MAAPSAVLRRAVLIAGLGCPVGLAVEAQSAVHRDADAGDVAAVRAHARLDRSLDLPSPKLGGRTPLHVAAERGHRDVVRLLLEAGARAGSRTTLGWTPLHLAAATGHAEVVSDLIQAGADAHPPDARGATPAHLAAENGWTAVLGRLRAAAPAPPPDVHGWTVLHRAAAFGHTEAARVALEWGVEVDARTDSGRTALHHAVRSGKRETAELLIEAGADRSARDLLGRTAEHTGPAGSQEIGDVGPGERPPVLFRIRRHGCPGPTSNGPPAGLDLALWPDGVILFSDAEHRWRVGRVPSVRLSFFQRELGGIGLLDLPNQVLGGPSTRVLVFPTEGRRRSFASSELPDRLDRHPPLRTEARVFLHAWELTYRELAELIPSRSTPVGDHTEDGRFRGLDPARPWALPWE